MDEQLRRKLEAALANLTAAQARLRSAFEFCEEVEGSRWMEDEFKQQGGWRLLQQLSNHIAERIDWLPKEANASTSDPVEPEAESL